jgi:hypothetical protein
LRILRFHDGGDGGGGGSGSRQRAISCKMIPGQLWRLAYSSKSAVQAHWAGGTHRCGRRRTVASWRYSAGVEMPKSRLAASGNSVESPRPRCERLAPTHWPIVAVVMPAQAALHLHQMGWFNAKLRADTSCFGAARCTSPCRGPKSRISASRFLFVWGGGVGGGVARESIVAS